MHADRLPLPAKPAAPKEVRAVKRLFWAAILGGVIGVCLVFIPFLVMAWWVR